MSLSLVLLPFFLAAPSVRSWEYSDLLRQLLREAEPDIEERINLGKSLEILARTNAGSRTLREAGLQDVDWLHAASQLDAAGIDLRVISLSDWAKTFPAFWTRDDKRFVIVIRSDVAKADPAALAPLLAHEITHVIDRRESGPRPDIMAPSEEHGYLRQIHVTLELERLGLLPEPDHARFDSEAELIQLNRLFAYLWQGKPLPPNSFGPGHAMQVRGFNDAAETTPGLDAFRAFVDMKVGMGYKITPWESDRSRQSSYVAEFRERILREDEEFKEWFDRPQPAPEVVSSPKEIEPVPDEPHETRPSRLHPVVVTPPKAYAPPIDPASFQEAANEEHRRLEGVLRNIKSFAAEECYHPGISSRDPIDRFLKDCDEIAGAWSGHGFRLPESALEGLTGCSRDFLLRAIAWWRETPAESREALNPWTFSQMALLAAKQNEPARYNPPPERQDRRERSQPSPYLGPCGNLGSSCTW